MKKHLAAILLLTLFIFPLTAKSNLFNAGYNIHVKYWGYDDSSLRSISFDYIHLKGDKTGFYLQVNPYYSLTLKNSGGIYNLSYLEYMSTGSNFIFGYGGDLNFGRFGLILGGGLFLDLNYMSASGDLIITVSPGLGAGINAYFHPGSGNFILNAGVTFSWKPWAYEITYIEDLNTLDYFNWGMTNANFNIGVGWRTGGIGSINNRSSNS